MNRANGNSTLDLTNPSVVKVSLLSKGINCDIDVFRDYVDEFYENVYVYGNTNKAERRHRFPQVLLLGNGVVSAFLRREDSPWELKIEGRNSAHVLQPLITNFF